MSYTTLEKKIHSIPEEYIEEVTDYIEFIIEKKKNKSVHQSKDLSSMFGVMDRKIDGIEMQRSLRDEWN